MAGPRLGKRVGEGLTMGPYLDRQYQNQYPWCPQRRQSKASAPLLGGILLPFQPVLMGTANVQPYATCLSQLFNHHFLGAKRIIEMIFL
jgi:hypothetical protein